MLIFVVVCFCCLIFIVESITGIPVRVTVRFELRVRIKIRERAKKELI